MDGVGSITFAMIAMKQRGPGQVSCADAAIKGLDGSLPRTTGRSSKLIYAWVVRNQKTGSPNKTAGDSDV